MKLASCSTAFDELFRNGDLTQLEWLDLCAREFAADGAVVDVRHFPRTDTDYLAEVKKMCADLGLTIAALRSDALLSADDAHAEQTFEIAIALGAPLIATPLPPETACSWNDALERMSAACSNAKRHNVTIALRNKPNTFAASVHDLKRATKEADSAWMRVGFDFSAAVAGDDAEALFERLVIAWHATAAPSADIRMLSSFRGFIVFDDAEGGAAAEETKIAFRAWRQAICSEVDRT